MKDMKGFITLNEMFNKIKTRGLNTFLDNLSFLGILFVWVFVVLCFGLLYYFLSGPDSALHYTAGGEQVSSIVDTIYFSFVTATTTGFGDILPSGTFKIIVILEVLGGLLLLALVTSKLVSLKQDIILSEIYEISFNEKINRMRSSLLLFRQNISRVISNIDAGTSKKREISDIYIHISALEDSLNDIMSLFAKSGNKHFTKEVDSLNAELILNSIISSFEKLDELVNLMNSRKIEWKREIAVNLMNKCISTNEKIFDRIISSKNLNDKTMAEIKSRKNKAVEILQKGIEHAKDKSPAKLQKDLKGFIEIVE